MIVRKIRHSLRSVTFLYKFHHSIKMKLVKMRFGLKDVDPTFYVAGKCTIAYGFKAGKHSYLGPGVTIGPNVHLGNYVMFASNAAVVGGDHTVDEAGTPMCFTKRKNPPTTTIGDDVWIGQGAVVVAGISIGRGAVIGANAVVTKSVDPYEIWAGVPARKIRSRFATAAERELHDKMLSSEAVQGSFGSPDSWNH